MKDTEKLYFLHKVRLLNMSMGQESFPTPPQSSGVKGRGGSDSWALPALLLPRIRTGQVTNDPVLLSEFGVMNAGSSKGMKYPFLYLQLRVHPAGN